MLPGAIGSLGLFSAANTVQQPWTVPQLSSPAAATRCVQQHVSQFWSCSRIALTTMQHHEAAALPAPPCS
jgi:hypothetical protein